MQERLNGPDLVKSILEELSLKFEEEWCGEAPLINPNDILLESVPNLGIF